MKVGFAKHDRQQPLDVGVERQIDLEQGTPNGSGNPVRRGNPRVFVAPVERERERLARRRARDDAAQPFARDRVQADGVERRDRIHELAVAREPAVEASFAEQGAKNLRVRSEARRQQRGVRPMGIVDPLDERMAQQRTAGGEVRAPLELFRGRGAQEVECQAHARPSARHVVLEVRVDALVAEIELRADREDQHIDIERGQAERRRQPGELGVRRSAIGQRVVSGGPTSQRRDRRLVERSRDRLGVHVQTAEGIVLRTSVARFCDGERTSNDCLETGDHCSHTIEGAHPSVGAFTAGCDHDPVIHACACSGARRPSQSPRARR